MAAECMDCGLPYEDFGLDSTLPDEQWLLIHDSFGGLLCANCMVLRADKLPGSIAIRMVIAFKPAATSPAPTEEPPTR